MIYFYRYNNFNLFLILDCITIIILFFASIIVRAAATRPLFAVATVVLERVDPRVSAATAGAGGPSAFAVAQQRGGRRHILRDASAATSEEASAHVASSSTAATAQATQTVGQRRLAVERGVRGRLTYRHWEEEIHEKVSVLSSHLERRVPGKCRYLREERTLEGLTWKQKLRRFGHFDILSARTWRDIQLRTTNCLKVHLRRYLLGHSRLRSIS